MHRPSPTYLIPFIGTCGAHSKVVDGPQNPRRATTCPHHENLIRFIGHRGSRSRSVLARNQERGFVLHEPPDKQRSGCPKRPAPDVVEPADLRFQQRCHRPVVGVSTDQSVCSNGHYRKIPVEDAAFSTRPGYRWLTSRCTEAKYVKASTVRASSRVNTSRCRGECRQTGAVAGLASTVRGSAHQSACSNDDSCDIMPHCSTYFALV